MFGLGMTEILMILAIALIIIGPKKLPELAKTLGQAMGEFKRSAQDFKRSIDVESAINDLDDIETPEPSLKDTIKNQKESSTVDDPESPEKDIVYPPPPENETADAKKESESEQKNSSSSRTPENTPENKS